MRKKVLFVITKGNFGGAQRYVYDLATSLPKTKYEAIVACGEGETLPNLLGEAGIRVIKLDSLQRDIKLSGDWQSFKKIYKILKQEKPDIIHLNSSKAGGLGALAGRLARIPKIIFTAHNWDFNAPRKDHQKFVTYFLHWLTVMLTHKTIAVSYKTKRDISHLPFMNKKIVVIHNGIEAFEPTPREEARKFLTGEEHSQKLVIYSLSELHKNKGIDVAFRAIKLLPEQTRNNLLYCVAGTGEEKEVLEKLAEELEIQNNIKLLDFVENAKKYLLGADVFLLPSRNEAFPYVILEAGLLGMPIVTTNVGGVPEVVKDMHNGILVHKENPKEIAHAIEYILKHPERSTEFSKKIHSEVSRHFSKTKMLRETTALYN